MTYAWCRREHLGEVVNGCGQSEYRKAFDGHGWIGVTA